MHACTNVCTLSFVARSCRCPHSSPISTPPPTSTQRLNLLSNRALTLLATSYFGRSILPSTGCFTAYYTRTSKLRLCYFTLGNSPRSSEYNVTFSQGATTKKKYYYDLVYRLTYPGRSGYRSHRESKAHVHSPLPCNKLPVWVMHAHAHAKLTIHVSVLCLSARVRCDPANSTSPRLFVGTVRSRVHQYLSVHVQQTFT